MDLQAYKAARENSRVTLLENWCRAIRISEDTHRSISAERMSISDAVAERIHQFDAKCARGAEDLRQALLTAALEITPEASVEVQGPTRDILIKFAPDKTVAVVNCGVDTMNGWGVYNINRDTKRETILLHARVPPWDREGREPMQEFAWYLWRGPFTTEPQSNWNKIDGLTLAQCI